MFMCKYCQEQFEDHELAYVLIAEHRLNHATPWLFEMKFCSKAHLQEFLHRIQNQQQRYVLTKKENGKDKQFEPEYPLDLLLLVGSNKG